MENGRFGLFHTFNAGAKVLPICGVLGAVLSVPGKQVLVMPYGILGTGYLHKHDRDLVLRSLAKMGPCWKLQYQSRNNQSQCVSSVHYAEAQRELIHWPRYQWLVVMVLIKEEIATLFPTQCSHSSQQSGNLNFRDTRGGGDKSDPPAVVPSSSGELCIVIWGQSSSSS
ncbi:hypothetical protein MJT46_014516 [Ovis ammon polii x Ovis aries]|nr:hypothetical protein MJT46_014516 [Ovis ammon polii x Ovis aries]